MSSRPDASRALDGQTRVVVTGMGTVNPIGLSVPEFWESLIAGKSGIRLARHTNVSEYPSQVAGEVDLPDVSSCIPKKMMRRLDRFVPFGHIAAVQAVQASGLTRETIDRSPSRFGVIMGTGAGGTEGHYSACRRIDAGRWDSVSPYYIVGVIPSTASSYVAREYNFQGPNFSVSSACASSNHAIGMASMLIKAGMADVMIAGGAEALAAQSGFVSLAVIDALSRRNDSPATASRPFDRDRDGFVLGEGAGVLCLERLDHAKRRGATIHAELKGVGFSCDAYDLVAPHPDGRGAAVAMANALDDARVNAEDVDLINAHGTSTPLGDLAESQAICRVFGGHAARVPVHSTKSMIGHLIGAAGGAEAIAAILAIERRVIHPSINVFHQDPDIPLNIVANEPQERFVDVVLSNSFGFGGENASLVFARYGG